MKPRIYKKRAIDMNKVERLQEHRMIKPFFQKNNLNKRKPTVRTSVPVSVPKRSTVPSKQKKVHIVNKSIPKDKPLPVPSQRRKSAYEIMREKAEQIRINWRLKREAIQAKQPKPSSTIKQDNKSSLSKVEEIKIRWKKKGATMD
jgi:hypothetical protein